MSLEKSLKENCVRHVKMLLNNVRMVIRAGDARLLR
jgi:hypothetical protein